MLQQAKPPSKSLFKSIIPLVVIAAAGYAVYRSGIIDRVMPLLTGRERHGDAELSAAILKDTPECAPYRAAILKYKGRSTSSDAARAAIDKALEDGLAAGCKKSDIGE